MIQLIIIGTFLYFGIRFVYRKGQESVTGKKSPDDSDWLRLLKKDP